MSKINDALFKDWMVLKERIFSEKFSFNNRELYLYYQISGFINPNLIGGTVSFMPLALIVLETNSKNVDDYYLTLFDESIKPKEVVENFVLEVLIKKE